MTTEEKKIIEVGGTAKLYFGMYEGKESACKVSRKKNCPYATKEIEVYKVLSTLDPYPDYFLKHYGATKNSDEKTEIHLELFHGKDVMNLMLDEGLSLSDRRHIILKVIEALRRLHSMGYVCMDLKPENVLFDPKSKRVILIDFGMSKKIGENIFNTCGTLDFLPYEMVKLINSSQDSFVVASEKIDIWTLGIFIHVILTGYSPYNEFYGNTLILIAKGQRHLSDKLKGMYNFFELILDKDPIMRPSLYYIEDYVTKLDESFFKVGY